MLWACECVHAHQSKKELIVLVVIVCQTPNNNNKLLQWHHAKLELQGAQMH